MWEFLGYLILTVTIIGTAVLIILTHKIGIPLLYFWIGVTIASLLILHFKKV